MAFVESHNSLSCRSRGITHLVATDVDGDLDTDVVAISGTGQDCLLVNDGTGHFFDDTFLTMPVDRVDGRQAVAADLNLDGHADLVIANHGAQNRLYLNRGDGCFYDKTPALPFRDDATRLVLVFDVDRDGDRDVVVVNDAEPSVLLISVEKRNSDRRTNRRGNEP